MYVGYIGELGLVRDGTGIKKNRYCKNPITILLGVRMVGGGAGEWGMGTGSKNKIM